MPEEIVYRHGVAADHIEEAARLYDEAFAAKLSPAIPDVGRRHSLLAAGIVPERALVAVGGSRLVGLAGFHHEGSALTSGITLGMMRRTLGLVGAARAAIVLGLLERSPNAAELLMDGIVVDADWRGRGIGSGLFRQLERFSQEHGYQRIRLDVVDTNPGARRLYERLGFEATRTERVGFLRPLMGFSAVTTMVKHLAAPTERVDEDD